MADSGDTYEIACAEHRWEVPEHYNIAADICDSHPREKLAMIHEHFSGAVREVTWGELQDLSGQAAQRARLRWASSAGIAWRWCCRRRRRRRRCSSRRGSSARCCCRCRCSTATRGSVTGSATRARGARHRRGQRRALQREVATPPAGARRATRSTARRREFDAVETLADDPAQLYYTSGTTGLAKGIVHAHRYMLAHEEFDYCHDVRDGERFHGMGEWAWAAGICPLLGPWRLGAVQCVYQREGGFDPTASWTSSRATR